MATNSSNSTEVQAAAALGAALVPAEQRVIEMAAGADGPVLVLALKDEGQTWELQDKAMEFLEENRRAPRERTNHPTFREQSSFEDYVNRFKGADSVLFADDTKSRVVAVFDYHPAGADQFAAGWGRHQAEYTCPYDPSWVAWAAADGKAMPQEELASFLDERSVDLVASDSGAGGELAAPTDVIMLCRKLHVVTKGTITRNVNETTGEYELVNKLEHVEQSTRIPKGFVIGVPVYVGGERYRVEVRLRFRVVEGRPLFTLAIQQKAETLRDAFKAVHETAGNETGLPVYVGTHNL
jgi:uncharacterized protein YfdQ (DUF2303 family)